MMPQVVFVGAPNVEVLEVSLLSTHESFRDKWQDPRWVNLLWCDLSPPADPRHRRQGQEMGAPSAPQLGMQCLKWWSDPRSIAIHTPRGSSPLAVHPGYRWSTTQYRNLGWKHRYSLITQITPRPLWLWSLRPKGICGISLLAHLCWSTVDPQSPVQVLRVDNTLTTRWQHVDNTLTTRWQHIRALCNVLTVFDSVNVSAMWHWTRSDCGLSWFEVWARLGWFLDTPL